MNRRQLLTAVAAADTAVAAREVASGCRLCVAVIGHTDRGNYGHGLDTVWLGVPETEIVAVADAGTCGRPAARKRQRAQIAVRRESGARRTLTTELTL